MANSLEVARMPSFSEKVVIFGPAFPMNLTPLWVAHDKGFFREEGLDVELESVLGIPDSQHPRFQWRNEGKVVFSSAGGAPPFRSMRQDRAEAGLSTTRTVINEKPELVKAMVRATLRGGEFARMNHDETIDCILRHQIHISRDLAELAWEEDHLDWGPLLDMSAYARKNEIYT